MQKRSKILCQNGHIALKFCIQDHCRHSSPICGDRSCEVHKSHEECRDAVFVDNMIDMLFERGKKGGKATDPISELYQSAINTMTKHYEQYEMTKPKYRFRLFGYEQKLYRLMNEGSPRDILPHLVSRVARSLEQTKIQDLEESVEINKTMETIRRKMKIIFAELRSKWEIWKDLRFMEKSQNQDQVRITDEGKTIKRLKINEFKELVFAFPSVQEGNIMKRIEMKVRKMNHTLGVGIGYKNSAMNQSTKWEGSIEDRSYMIFNDGTVSYYKKDQNSGFTDFRFERGDIVVLQIDMVSLHLSIYNKASPSKKAVIQFRKQKNNPLHFCLMLHYYDKVQLM